MATPSNKRAATQRRAELAAKQAAMARAEQRRKWLWGGGSGLLVVALVIGLVVFFMRKQNSDNAAASAAQAQQDSQGESDLLAPAWSGLTGQEIDGVSSNQMEQLAYHIHAHLAIYVNGKQMTVPYGIGIAQPWSTEPDNGSYFVDSGGAFYYLHTHDDTGVIHIESPTSATYTLGQFFAEWNQQLSTTQIGKYTGSVITYVNNAKYTGDPADIKLTAHDVIQLDLGQNVPFQPYTFASGL
jgi:hypothetical protein